jgi:hypothetical protein
LKTFFYVDSAVLRDVFISEPLSYSLAVGQKNVSVHCYGIGYPRPTLMWYKEGHPRLLSVSINGTRTSNNNISRNNVSSQLFLTNPENGVTFNEAGNNTCEAYSNYFNETRRKTIEILCKY